MEENSTDRRREYDINNIKKDFRKEVKRLKLEKFGLREQYNTIKKELENKYPQFPSLIYLYRIFKNEIKGKARNRKVLNENRFYYQGFRFTKNYSDILMSSMGEKVFANLTASCGYKVKEKSYSKMNRLVRNLKRKGISHNRFFEDNILKNLKNKKKSAKIRTLNIYDNSWDYLYHETNWRKTNQNDEDIKLLKEIILENIQP